MRIKLGPKSGSRSQIANRLPRARRRQTRPCHLSMHRSSLRSGGLMLFIVTSGFTHLSCLVKPSLSFSWAGHRGLLLKAPRNFSIVSRETLEGAHKFWKHQARLSEAHRPLQDEATSPENDASKKLKSLNKPSNKHFQEALPCCC